jgi:hypothetical protein
VASSWKQKILFYPDSKCLAIYEYVMFIAVIYSCFTSAFTVAFEPPQPEYFIAIEHFVCAVFTLDIVMKFLKVPDVEDNK